MPNFTLFRENVVFFHAGGTLAIAGALGTAVVAQVACLGVAPESVP